MRVVVTGANGLVGSRLSALLAQRGHHVTGCSRGPWRGPLQAIQRFEYRSCQLSNEREVRELFAIAQPEVVIHCASMTDVDACERDPLAAYASNVESAAQISSNARLLRAHVICVSTDYVFDGAAGPYSEDAVPTPRGVYSTTKHIAEQIVQTLAFSWAIARTAVVYGWPPASRPAEMLVELAERKLTGIWNISGATVANRVEFGTLVCEIFGFDKGLLIPSRLRDAKLIAPRPPHSGLKTNKAQQELAHQPLELPAALHKFQAEWRHA